MTIWLDPVIFGELDEYSETNACDTSEGYHENDLHTGSQQKASERRTAGDRVGWYNFGPRAAFPNWTITDCPLTEQRAAWWIAYKYELDHIFQWHLWWYAESYATYGGAWKCPMDTAKLVQSGEYEDRGVHEGTLVWTLSDTVTSIVDNDRGYDGPMASMRLKAIRRAQMDYQYLYQAERLGINVDPIIDSICGRAFDNYGDDDAWPEAYAYGYNFQPHWREQGHYYETYRRVLADSIIGRQ